MDTGVFITQVQKFGYDIQDRTTSVTAQDTKTRERILRSAQSGCEEIRGRYPWPFRMADITTIGVVSGDYSAGLPADFQAFGPRCTIYRTADGVELRRVPLPELRRLRLKSPSTAEPNIWAPISNAYINVYPAGNNPTLTITDYLKTFDALEDEDAGGDATTLDAALPEHFQTTLLFDWCVIDLKLYGGDENYLPMRLEFEKRLRQMWADENLMPGVQRVPRYGRGHLRA